MSVLIGHDVGRYEMVGPDFLESFVGRMAGKEKSYLKNRLNQDWDWVDNYIKATGWIGPFRERLGL